MQICKHGGTMRDHGLRLRMLDFCRDGQAGSASRQFARLQQRDQSRADRVEFDEAHRVYRITVNQ